MRDSHLTKKQQRMLLRIIVAAVLLIAAKLLPLTGYVHGGCSPVGMKKQFPTVLDESVEGLDTIVVSAGKIGAQVELAPAALCGLIRGKFAPVAK